MLSRVPDQERAVPPRTPRAARFLDKLERKWQVNRMVSDKHQRLRELLSSYGSCLVAYSGGVDSVLLAYVAHQVLGQRSMAAIADSPSLPRRELEEALTIAERYGFPARVVHTHEFEDARYLSNPTNRCYFCKHELFTELEPIARSEGFAVIAYGENASDLGDFRPGAEAARQFQVRAPLKEVGLTKPEIRELSAELGLPTADKPQMACLSSRIPVGEPVSPEKLSMIEQAEYVLRDLGFHDVRVRHHELRSSLPVGQPQAGGDPNSSAGAASPNPSLLTHLARIEVGVTELPRFLENGLSLKVARALKQIGYAHVTVDLAGYRRGSANGVPSAP